MDSGKFYTNLHLIIVKTIKEIMILKTEPKTQHR